MDFHDFCSYLTHFLIIIVYRHLSINKTAQVTDCYISTVTGWLKRSVLPRKRKKWLDCLLRTLRNLFAALCHEFIQLLLCVQSAKQLLSIWKLEKMTHEMFLISQHNPVNTGIQIWERKEASLSLWSTLPSTGHESKKHWCTCAQNCRVNWKLGRVPK